jgi:hypothetical protein
MEQRGVKQGDCKGRAWTRELPGLIRMLPDVLHLFLGDWLEDVV